MFGRLAGKTRSVAAGAAQPSQFDHVRFLFATPGYQFRDRKNPQTEGVLRGRRRPE